MFEPLCDKKAVVLFFKFGRRRTQNQEKIFFFLKKEYKHSWIRLMNSFQLFLKNYL